MGEWTDTPGDWLAILSIMSIILAALVWLIRAVTLQGKQFRPNGGNSLRDTVNDIRTDQRSSRDEISDLRTMLFEQNERVNTSMSKVHARIDDHLRDHLKGTL